MSFENLDISYRTASSASAIHVKFIAICYLLSLCWNLLLFVSLIGIADSSSELVCDVSDPPICFGDLEIVRSPRAIASSAACWRLRAT